MTDRNEPLSDATFHRVYETLTLPVLIVAADGTILYAGGSCERDLGWDPEYLRGRNIVEFLPADHLESALQSMADLDAHAELGIGVPTVYPILRPDGGLTWHAIGAVPLQDDPLVEAISFYFLPWDAQLAFDDSIAASLAGAPLSESLRLLSRSIAISLEALGTAIHHGFDGERFEAHASFGVPDECLDADGDGDADTPWHRSARSGEPQFVSIDHLPANARSTAQANGIAGLWAIPLPESRGLKPAVVSVWRRRDLKPVTAHDFVIARSLRYVQLTLLRAAEQAQLEYLATHDHLTDVANRRLFTERLTETLATRDDVIVMFCDLDAFKNINDTLGHKLGDEVLAETARRLRSAIPDDALLARMGGDEFTVMLHGSLDEATATAERMVTALEEPMHLEGSVVRVALSVGIAQAQPGSTAGGLLNRADSALYEVKRAGGSRIWTAPLPGNHPARRATDQ